jgi:signal transduction histidine kinase
VKAATMNFIAAPLVTQRTIVRVLAAGFTLVIVLLVGASIVGFRNARLVQRGVQTLVDEQLVISRLVTEMQVEQATLNAVFYQLAQVGDSMDRDALLAQLNDTRQAFARILEDSKGTPEEGLWRQLNEQADKFSQQLATVMSQPEPTAEAIEALAETHETAIPIVTKLIASGSANAADIQQRIETESRHLITEWFLFLAPGLTCALALAVLTLKIASQLLGRMRSQASELSRVSWHMLQGQESIARRFSHELHDELGQSLTAVKANLVAITPQNLEARRADCLHVLDEAVSNVSELSQLLRPVILDDLGLDAGLRWLADKFSARTNIDVKYVSHVEERLPDELETHLFRIAQEALTNVARHSGATEASIEFQAEANESRLRIKDNGHGLPARSSTRRHGLGLIGMRARAENAGGDLRINSSSGGVVVEAIIPTGRTLQHVAEEAPRTAG